jgi:hypothetical protein
VSALPRVYTGGMANLNEQYLNIHTPPQGYLLDGNTNIAAALAEALVDALPEGAQVPLSLGPGADGVAIGRAHVEFIAELLHEVVAYTVSTIIDAGSERDAVMENDTLRTALEQELYGWAVP